MYIASRRRQRSTADHHAARPSRSTTAGSPTVLESFDGGGGPARRRHFPGCRRFHARYQRASWQTGVPQAKASNWTNPKFSDLSAARTHPPPHGEGELETATDVSNECTWSSRLRVDPGPRRRYIGIVPTSGHDDLNRFPAYESASCPIRCLRCLDMDPTQKQQNRSSSRNGYSVPRRAREGRLERQIDQIGTTRP